MAHVLELRYGLTAEELMDAVHSRFRLRAALEGAVAEVQMERHIRALPSSVVDRYESHDKDGYADFSIWLPGRSTALLAECKNVRESSKVGGECYRENGEVVAYKVETQKTRASKEDSTSRYYDVRQFDILGVCIGKKTGCWSDVLFVRVQDLKRHAAYQEKLAVMQRVPLPTSANLAPWFSDLGALLKSYQ